MKILQWSMDVAKCMDPRCSHQQLSVKSTLQSLAGTRLQVVVQQPELENYAEAWLVTQLRQLVLELLEPRLEVAEQTGRQVYW